MNESRLKDLLQNAILWIIEANGGEDVPEYGGTYEWYENVLGITKEEMYELDIDWLEEV